MALSHVVMHVLLCNSAARLKAADVPVHVVVTDRLHRPAADTTVRVARTGGADGTAEFDVPWGLYLAQATMHSGHTTCMQNQFFSVLPDHNRELTMQLQNGAPATAVPTLISGSVPGEFSYAQPTIVLFGKDTKCNGPVGNTVDANIEQKEDDQAYYAAVYPTPSLEQNGPVTIAVRLTDSSGGYHYLRVPSNFLHFGGRIPGLDQLDISDGLIDFIAGKPEDTLLCLRGYETTTEIH